MGRDGVLLDSATVSDGEGNSLLLIVYRLEPLEVHGARVMIETRWALSNQTSGILATVWEGVYTGANPS